MRKKQEGLQGSELMSEVEKPESMFELMEELVTDNFLHAIISETDTEELVTLVGVYSGFLGCIQQRRSIPKLEGFLASTYKDSLEDEFEDEDSPEEEEEVYRGEREEEKTKLNPVPNRPASRSSQIPKHKFEA